MNNWIKTLFTLTAGGKPAVLVTIVGARGSSPRGQGAKMVVTGDDCHGSVGGGQLEHRCISTAREMLGLDGRRLLEKFILGEPLDQCCGGAVEVLFESFADAVPGWLTDLHGINLHRQNVVLATDLSGKLPGKTVIRNTAQLDQAGLPGAVPGAVQELLDSGRGACLVDDVLSETITAPDLNVAVFGAGHVGKALVNTLSGLDARIRWIDDREGMFGAIPAGVDAVHTNSPAREVTVMPPGSFFLVMTHSHALDFGICTAVLSRNDAAYCGLIGSASKRRRFEKRFQEHGLDEAMLKSFVCPIGIDGISGKRPAAIAIAAAAEILQLHERAQMSKED